MSRQPKLRVLYLVYWGATEPLGQSLVLPAVRRLAALGVDLTLITFEKPTDFERDGIAKHIRASLDGLGVRWVPLRYHKQPRVPATAFDIAHACARAVLAQVRLRFDVIHARTFIGGLAGMTLAPLLGAKFVYHNEGFYPDEQVDGGFWPLNSRPHRVAKSLERRMYERADGVITLSHRAKAAVEDLPAVRRKGTPVVVVPSCVDLGHFTGRPSERAPDEDDLRFIYVGSIGGRYCLDKVSRFAAVARGEAKKLRLKVVTRTDPAVVKSFLDAGGLPEDAWSVESAAYSDMPAQLAGEHAGLFFLTQGISEHACSPTKLGEYWAMGLPVITTPNVSDTDEIIRRERVGVVVEHHTDAGYRQAFQEFRALLKDRELPLRCRRAAERHYALEPACERQIELYRGLLNRAPEASSRVGASGISRS